jgi:F-box-like
MTTPLSLPLELIFKIIEIADDQPTLAALSLVCHDFYGSCTPSLWHHLNARGFENIATIILALRSNPQLARHVQTVAFMYDETIMNCMSIDEEVERSSSLKGKVLEVWEGQGDVEVTAGGTAWSDIVELLPEKLLCELDANGLPPAERSYAMSFNLDLIWYTSFENGLIASPTGTLRCLCLTGWGHYSFGSGIVKPFALHLYGQPGDWTLLGGPTFIRLAGIKCICLSIYTWDDSDDHSCNIFECCSKYDMFHGGGLEKVVIRMTQKVIAKLCRSFEQFNWPKARDVVEFRLWDFADLSHFDIIMQELTDGTWYDWLDWPEVLGQKISFENLTKGLHPTNA